MAKQAEGKENRTCFVISPIGEENSDVRRRADQILKHIITPAAKECGYDTVRADKIAEPGIITSQVIQHIVEDPMVVADLTGRNPNVFYELAIRHAIRKPVVQLIQHNEAIPFDVAVQRTIKVNHHDLDSVADCRDQLVKQIKAAQADPGSVDSPITVALNVQNLRESDNPLALSAAELISGMNELKSMVAGVMDATMMEIRYGRDFEMMQFEELMHAARSIRALTAATTEKGSSAMPEEVSGQLRELGARIEHLARRNEDMRFRKRGGFRPPPSPPSSKKVDDSKPPGAG